MAPSSHRKRQTRLTFNPLPSSSPATTQYSSAIQDRPSGIGYAGSPAMKTREMAFKDGSDELVSDVKVPPTPARSSQHVHNSSQDRSKCKDKQRQINFAHHIGTKLKRNEEAMPRSSARTAMPKKNPFRGTNNTAFEVSSDTSSSDDDIPHHSSPPSSSRLTRARPQPPNDESNDENDEDVAVRRSGRKNKPRASIVISSDEEGAAGKDADWNSVSGNDTDAGKAIQEVGEAETSGDEVMYSSPTKKAKANFANARGRGRAHQLADVMRGGGCVEGDDELQAAPAKQGKRKWKRESKPVYDEVNFIVDDDDEVEEEESDDEPLGRPMRTSKAIEIDSDNESDEVVQTPAKRRRLAQQDQGSNRRKKRQEEEDLAEDLDFLGSASNSSSRSRSRGPTKSDPRREALEDLKRKRAANSDLPSSAPKPTLQRRRKALYDTDSEDEDEEQHGSVSENAWDDDDDEESTLQPTAREMFEEDSEEEDFIDEDDDPLGVPDADHQLPLEFSNLRFRKAKDLFKYAVEWFIQKRLNPSFSFDTAKDELYELAFDRINHEAQGLTGSKFKSAAWTPSFTRTLNARPHIHVMETGADGMHHCEACNRKSHPATWEIQFSGLPYNAKTLEDLDQDADDSEASISDNDEEGEVRDALGNLLPPATHIFHVGRTCQQNASTAHTLEHWRYHLYEWIKEHLKLKGHLTPVEVAKRDGWKTQKRKRFAEKVTDEMEESGAIATLYSVFKAEIEAAHEAKGSGYERYERQ